MLPITIRAVDAGDRAAWDSLWAGYLDFYDKHLPARVTDQTFARLTQTGELYGFLAVGADNTALGLVHFLFHCSSFRSVGACYLEDLFVAPAARRQHVGRRLIEAVVAAAQVVGSNTLYWQTEEFNGTARRLYERVARRTPFIRYQIDLVAVPSSLRAR